MFARMDGELVFLPKSLSALDTCKRMRAFVQGGVSAELVCSSEALRAGGVGAVMGALIGGMGGEDVAAEIVAAGVGVRAGGVWTLVWALVGVRADVSGEVTADGEGA